MNAPATAPAGGRGVTGLLKTAVSAALLGYIFWRFDIRTIAGNLLAADARFVACAFAAFIASGILGAVQWFALLRFHDLRPTMATTLKRYFMGLFFNYILPGFVGGDAVRVYTTARETGQGARTFTSTLADRVIGFLVLVGVSLGAYGFLPGDAGDDAFLVAVAMFALLAGFIAVVAIKPLGRLLHRAFGGILPPTLTGTLTEIYHEMHRLTRAPGTLAGLFALALVIQFLRIGVHCLAGRAVGIEVGFMYFALFVPLVEVVASLPISLGGVGVRETIAFMLFSSVGVPQATVVSYTLLATAVGFAGAIPGGVAFILDMAKRPAP